MDVVSPKIVGMKTFENQTNHVERTITFFVVSPEEQSMLEEHARWEQEEKKSIFNDVVMPIVTWFLCIGLGLGLILLAIREDIDI